MKKNTLAIVIPAYKANFLYLALESISKQTCKDFVLYIGDDSSPDDLYSIVKQFNGKINLHFRRFNENIGGKDLAGQWARCIDMIQNEEWIWLFSDDDIMDEKCVERFYHTINKYPQLDVVHFNSYIIGIDGGLKAKANKFPEFLSAETYFSLRINNKILSFIVDYIFKIEIYEQVDRFKKFPLAWCADDAFWIKMATQNAIYTIDETYVYWRISDANISGTNDNFEVANKKINACIEYLNWVNDYMKDNDIMDITTKADKFKWFSRQLLLVTSAIGFFDGLKILFNFYQKFNCSLLSLFNNTLIYIYIRTK